MPAYVPAMVSTFLKVGALALLLPLGGCWSFHPGQHYETVSKTPGPDVSTWPTRDLTPLGPILEATPSEFPRVLVLGDENLLTPEQKKYRDQKETIVYKGIHGKALLRIFSFESPSREARAPDTSRQEQLRGPGFPANARIITSRTLSGEAESAARSKMLEVPEPEYPRLPMKAAATPPKPMPFAFLISSEIADTFHLYSGKPIRIPPVRSPGEYKGLILHFQAIAYNDYEPQVLAEFERRGWAVIDIDTETSTQPPLDPEQVAHYQAKLKEAYAVLEQIYADQRKDFPEEKALATTDPAFKEYSRRFSGYPQKHPLYHTYTKLGLEAAKTHVMSFQACEGADLDSIATQVAERIDQATAGNAYAAQAVLDYAKTQRPDLANIPVVMIGFSAGALTTPTAAALLRDELSAVVVIGGAANLFLTAQGSSLTDGGVRIRCKEDKVSKETIAQISDLYLKHSKLDPYHTAPMISHLPVLQVHATTDTWVPAKQGELLFERLNHPDRLDINAGHELLFYFLPGKSRFIAEWVERAAGVTPVNH